MTEDPEIFGKVREELQQQEALRVALGKAAELRMDEPGSQRVAAETVFHCAQLGVDDAAVRKLLRSLLDLRILGFLDSLCGSMLGSCFVIPAVWVHCFPFGLPGRRRSSFLQRFAGPVPSSACTRVRLGN